MVPQELLDQLHQRQTLLAGRLVDARVDEVFVQQGATALHGGGVGLLLVYLLLLLGLLLGLDVLMGRNKKKGGRCFGWNKRQEESRKEKGDGGCEDVGYVAD